jgi:hypothetical protein
MSLLNYVLLKAINLGNLKAIIHPLMERIEPY